MSSFLRLVTDVSAEVVTRAEAKAHAKIEVTDDDALVDNLIKAAREVAQRHTSRLIGVQTWALVMDAWPVRAADDWWDGAREGSVSSLYATKPAIDLPFAPLTSATLKVLSADGSASTDFAGTYLVRDDTTPRLVLQRGTAPPTPLRDVGGLEVHMVGGFDASTLPGSLKVAMLSLVSHWYERREAGVTEAVSTVPMQTQRILDQFKAMRL